MLPSLAFFFVVIVLDYEWREAPGTVGYASYEECKEGQIEYRMNDEAGTFSECYAKEVIERGE